MKFLNRFSRKKLPTSDPIPTNETPMSKLKFHDIKDLMRDPTKVDGEVELQRMEAYVERPVQQLLRKLLETNPAEIVPTYDLERGFRYTTVETLLYDNAENIESAEAFLERLHRLDILEKQFFDTVSVCPSCRSTTVTLHNHCPKCTSRYIAKTSLTEHIPCGNIDERERYLHETCPKCGLPLVQDQYRDMGRWYICRACRERFETPQLDLICRTCSNEFTMQDALIQTISKYSLNPARESEIRQNVTSLESIHALLTDLGFVVEMPGSIVGEKSGIQQYFSLIATNSNKENIVIEHRVNEPEVNASQLILYLYKLSEIHTDLPIFVAIPRLSDTAKQIAEGYQIKVIEGIPTDKNQLSTLKQVIHEHLTQETPPLTFETQIPPTADGPQKQVDTRLVSHPEINQAPNVIKTLDDPLEQAIFSPLQEDSDPIIIPSHEENHIPTATDEIKERFFRVLHEKSSQTTDVRQQWLFRRGKFIESWRNGKGKFVEKPDT
jgi:ssDNA-binding Zn-finger/Zn-ribbon topoisomerase 1